MLEIHRDVPTPPPPGYRPRLYPFKDMSVGESFYVPVTEDAPLSKVAYRLYMAVQGYRKTHGRHFRFAVRRLDDRVGCWRTA